MIKQWIVVLAVLALIVPTGAWAAGAGEGKPGASSHLCDPEDLECGGGGGGGGGTPPPSPQYRISVAVYEIAVRPPTLTQAGDFKVRGWTRFEQNIGGNWTKVDADWIQLSCFGSGVSDDDEENNAGFVDIEDWSGPIYTGGLYPVTCFHNARKNGTTYSAVSSALVPIQSPTF